MKKVVPPNPLSKERNLSFLYASTGTVAAGGPFFYGSLLSHERIKEIGLRPDLLKEQAP
ncbi:MAG: hypothetical protein HRT88_19930 [Lentisphaeraceae bacterium]|nr:hypothetical protein [Lentisphaeraceae bacterium]